MGGSVTIDIDTDAESDLDEGNVEYRIKEI